MKSLFMKWPGLLLLFISLSLAASPYLLVDLDPTSLIISSDQQKSLEVSIRNPNIGDASLSIALLGEINSWGTIDESEVEVAAGETEATTLYVGVPKTAAAGTYGMTISISGAAGEEPVSESKSFSVRVRAEEKFLIDFTKDRTVASPGDTIHLTISLENQGNVVHDTDLVARIGGTPIETKPVDLLPFSSEALSLSLEVPNTISPGERVLSLSLESGDTLIESTEETITLNSISKVTTDKQDQKEFWHREITYTITNEGNNREVLDIGITLSRLEQAFMTSNFDPDSRDGGELIWNIALLPGEETTVSILTYGSVLYIGYILVLTILLLSAYLTYTKVINKPPVELEKKVVGISRRENKNEVVIGIYIRNTSSKAFSNVMLTDSVSSFFDVKKFEGLSPDQVNEREKDIEYIWTFKEMRPHEERAIIYHMEGSGAINLKPANIRFQSGSKTFFKKTGPVAVTG